MEQRGPHKGPLAILMNDHITSVTAGAAIASPFWLPSLMAVSQVAACVFPILGCIWLIIQMAAHFRNKNRP